eukprot:2652951-Rhodomonas_salina.1
MMRRRGCVLVEYDERLFDGARAEEHDQVRMPQSREHRDFVDQIRLRHSVLNRRRPVITGEMSRV